jgi:hypothetical protein
VFLELNLVNATEPDDCPILINTISHRNLVIFSPSGDILVSNLDSNCLNELN